MLLSVKQFRFVANNINRADFNDRCQSMSNVSPDKDIAEGVTVQLQEEMQRVLDEA